MHFSTLVVAALASIASAVDVQVVSVASTNNTLKFYPERITAPVGSMVQFQFRGGNHSIVQSAFDAPCIPISVTNTSAVGIFSGYQPVAASQAMGMIPVFTVMINNTAPMWLYCSQGRHCQSGMVMVINENTAANSTRSLENYKLGAAGAQVVGQTPTIGGGQTTAQPTDAAGNPVPASGASSLMAPSTLLVALSAAFLLM